MSKRILDVDPFTGVTTYHDYDPQDDKTYIGYEADVTAELEASKQLANDPDYWQKGVKNDLAHYAHIPDIVLLQWHAMGVDIRDAKAILQMVNKPEYSYLKVTAKKHA